jgi:hypothetical protein
MHLITVHTPTACTTQEPDTLSSAGMLGGIIAKYPELMLYIRYIDDVIGIWTPMGLNDDIQWRDFQNDMNNFGRLRWEFSTRKTTVNFLDIAISINTLRNIQT